MNHPFKTENYRKLKNLLPVWLVLIVSSCQQPFSPSQSMLSENGIPGNLNVSEDTVWKMTQEFLQNSQTNFQPPYQASIRVSVEKQALGFELNRLIPYTNPQVIADPNGIEVEITPESIIIWIPIKHIVHNSKLKLVDLYLPNGQKLQLPSGEQKGVQWDIPIKDRTLSIYVVSSGAGVFIPAPELDGLNNQLPIKQIQWPILNSKRDTVGYLSFFNSIQNHPPAFFVSLRLPRELVFLLGQVIKWP